MQYSEALTYNNSRLRNLPDLSDETSGWAPQNARERQWIERSRHGDLEAFNALVMSYQGLVFRQALWILREEEAAEDATQETFLKAYRKISTFLDGKSFRAWILSITTNQCLDMIRRAKRHPRQPLEPSGPDGEEFEDRWIIDPGELPEQAMERMELERKLSGAIQGLPLKYRTVVILVDLQQLEYAEASEILALPIGTMKSRLSRARRKLRLALQ